MIHFRKGGSNYTSVPDSTNNAINSPFNITYQFEENKEYKLVLLPQDRVHTLKNVHYGNEKRKGSPGLSVQGAPEHMIKKKSGQKPG
ncbi:MAG: hypothetical protein K9G49_04560 [Taibaiella sp.]|nr:hypothetical protein [Taibaiella sp.]